MRYALLLLVFLSMLYGCIGTDIVDDPTFEARITITPRIDSLALNQSQQFMATYIDEYGQEPDVAITWQTSNPALIAMDSMGLATRIDTGAAYIVASAEELSDTLFLDAGVSNSLNTRMGSFVNGQGSYVVSGTARLMENENQVTLMLESDFSSSAGPGVYIFLANNTTGPYNYTPGSQVMDNNSVQVTANKLTSFSGPMSYNLPAGVSVNDYQYVVIYCVTINGIFGYAELN